MDDRNLEKALAITAKLIAGENVGSQGENVKLYEDYSTNSSVYDYLHLILKNFNMELYEYNNALFVSAGENNRIFGFSNEELRKAIGLRTNRELYMCYFIIYNTITAFYKDSASYTFAEFVKSEDVIASVDATLFGVVDRSGGIVVDEVEENSFKTLALLWDELPVVSVEDPQGQRAAKNSKTGFVKLTFNFLVLQGLFVENQGKYYPTDKFKAFAENYFGENRSRLYEILKGEQNAAD